MNNSENDHGTAFITQFFYWTLDPETTNFYQTDITRHEGRPISLFIEPLHLSLGSIERDCV